MPARSYRVLVTGGAGFIGSHIVDRLVKNGHKVAVIDDLSEGKLQNLNKAATFYHLDITQARLEDVFHREEPEIVIHHAAQASVSRSVQDPARDAAVNVLGSLRLMDISRKSQVRCFVFASTGGAIYGEPQALPCTEDHPTKPLSPYGQSKLTVEQYLELFHRLYELNYVCLRYSNVYGPRQDPHGEAGVVAIFTRMMLDHKQPTIFGTGEQERDFVYVDDVVDANMLAMEKPNNRCFNIGTGQGTSVNYLFELLAKLIKYRWKPVYGAPRPGDVFKIRLDVSRAAQELGWTPKTTLEQGLMDTVEHFHKSKKRGQQEQPS